ncbi:hypothetical protein KY317_04120 [Candidatus Woesearchaeota archaeon]|nr:hypothetical protein [Candidatus Woesearchaeota archaeon]
MVYDSSRNVVVLFGGESSQGCDFNNETWEYNGTDWTQVYPDNAPSARGQIAMAYDSAREKTVLFGGQVGVYDFLNETWEYG